MRTNILFVVACLMLCALAGCDNDHHAVPTPDMPQPNKLSLTAPNGQQIAESMEALRASTAADITEQFGDDCDFTITSIEYAPLKEGYLALIGYRLADGSTSNYALSNNREVLVISPVDEIIYAGPVGPLQYGEDGELSIDFPISASAADSTSWKCKSSGITSPAKAQD